MFYKVNFTVSHGGFGFDQMVQHSQRHLRAFIMILVSLQNFLGHDSERSVWARCDISAIQNWKWPFIQTKIYNKKKKKGRAIYNAFKLETSWRILPNAWKSSTHYFCSWKEPKDWKWKALLFLFVASVRHRTNPFWPQRSLSY